MNPPSASGTLQELVADPEICAVMNFFNQNSVDNPIGPWDLHRNDNQTLRTNGVSAPFPLPGGLIAGFSPHNDFIDHRFVLNEIISSMINTRMTFYVEAYLACLQAVHGQQLTLGQAIVILRNHLPSTTSHNPHFGRSASASTSFVPPIPPPMPPGFIMSEPGTTTGIPMEASEEFETGSALGACGMRSLRRVFSDGDRVKVECLWPNCGRTMMKDNHPRHIRECHLRARRAITRRNNSYLA